MFKGSRSDGPIPPCIGLQAHICTDCPNSAALPAHSDMGLITLHTLGEGRSTQLQLQYLLLPRVMQLLEVGGYAAAQGEGEGGGEGRARPSVNTRPGTAASTPVLVVST